MADTIEPNGKNSLVGEFLLAVARAPEALQEAIIMQALKQMRPYHRELIAPYPMLSHMVKILGLANTIAGDPKK